MLDILLELVVVKVELESLQFQLIWLIRIYSNIFYLINRLAKLGGRVGLLDADIYGPSLPSMINPANTKSIYIYIIRKYILSIM